MNWHQFALLAAVAVQVVPVVVLNFWLYLRGERGTLLLPGFGGFPKVELAAAEDPLAEQAAAEEEPERKAA